MKIVRTLSAAQPVADIGLVEATLDGGGLLLLTVEGVGGE